MKLGQITNETITFAFLDSEKKRGMARRMMARYACVEDGVPIFRRKYEVAGAEQTGLINQKINVDHFSEIVDDSVGYFLGQPVKVSINKDRYAREKSLMAKLKDAIIPSSEAKTIEEANYALQRFGIINDIDLLNAESAKLCAIAGYSGRMTYFDPAGEIRIKNIYPDQCAFYDDCAFYFFSEYVIDGATKKEQPMCWAFDATTLYIAKMTAGAAEIIDRKGHELRGVPLVCYRNNADEHGDAYKALSLIDEYDRIVSDWANESEQFRLAFLALIGVPQEKPKDGEPTLFDNIKQYGGCFIPQGGDAKYITKQIPHEQVVAILSELRANIFTVTATPNPHDANFSGNSSGVALEYKYRPRDNKTIIKERFFTEALRETYRLACTAMKDFGKANVDYSSVDFGYTRNFPKNILEEAQIQTYLDGKVPVKDRLKLCSFIVDPEAAAKELEGEKEDALSYAPKTTGSDLLNQSKVATGNDAEDGEA